MKKKENLVGYEKPECTIVELAIETFTCSSKVKPSAPGFEEEDWEDKGDIDAGEFETE